VATLHVRNVPDELYEALRRCAEAEGRSIGAQVIVIVEDALARPGPRRLLGLRRRVGRRRGFFTRFTEPARTAVVRAEEEARALKHNYVGTEHLLLGVAGMSDDVGAKALELLGIQPAAVRAEVVRAIGEGDEQPGAQVPFTPRAKKVLELSLREALALGNDYIGTEHILLGLAAEEEGVAARILRERGAGADAIRAAVLQLLSSRVVADPEAELDPREWEYRAEALTGSAESWTEQMNALAADGWELFAITREEAENRAVFRRAA